MSNLINAVINGVIKEERTETRNGKYRVTEYIGVSQGARNRPEGYWEHVWETGGCYKNDSFYGDNGEPFASAEEAAKVIIKRRGIVAVDANNRAVFRKGV